LQHADQSVYRKNPLMKIAKLSITWTLAVAATWTIGACNMITGADSLKIGPSLFDEQTPAGSSGAGGHGASSSGGGDLSGG
jgi:hypothetical protein